MRSKTVEFYILNNRGLLLGSPDLPCGGYPTIDKYIFGPKQF